MHPLALIRSSRSLFTLLTLVPQVQDMSSFLLSSSSRNS